MVINSKNKQAPILMSKSIEENTDTSKEVLHLTWYRFYLTKGYLRVDLVGDCSFENLIKVSEKGKRNSATKMVIKPPKSKVPGDF